MSKLDIQELDIRKDGRQNVNEEMEPDEYLRERPSLLLAMLDAAERYSGEAEGDGAE